jgi:hypothetical protein
MDLPKSYRRPTLYDDSSGSGSDSSMKVGRDDDDLLNSSSDSVFDELVKHLKVTDEDERVHAGGDIEQSTDLFSDHNYDQTMASIKVQVPVVQSNAPESTLASHPESFWGLDDEQDEYFLSQSTSIPYTFPHLRLPSTLFHALYAHQTVGVQWMASLHENCKGGICSDDMVRFCSSCKEGLITKHLAYIHTPLSTRAWAKRSLAVHSWVV